MDSILGPVKRSKPTTGIVTECVQNQDGFTYFGEDGLIGFSKVSCAKAVVDWQQNHSHPEENVPMRALI